MLLRSDQPIVPPWSTNHVLCLPNWRNIRVARSWSKGQPSVFLGRSGKVRYVPIVGAGPVGQFGFAPGHCGDGVERLEFGEVRVDGAKVVVNPSEGELDDEVGGDDNVLWVLQFTFHY